MFYSQIILAKKGPLGKVWQAAHWGDKKLGRPAIFATDISATVDTITNPAAPMALRVSGHLLLGVVRIYSRQVKYLIDDCQQAMVKVKMAYRLTTGAGGNKGAEAAIIDIEVNPAGARALNISNFGEYSELDFSHANFEIPFDITNETAEEDWVPAELHGQTLDFAPEQPALHSDEDSFGAVASGKKSGARLGAGAEEEEWGAFEPDDDEQDENKSKDDSTVSEIEKTRAANNESMVSDPNVCIEALDISGVATYRL
jgi:cohesin complex subunit SCC1